MQSENAFQNSVSRPSLEDVLAEEIKKHDEQTLFDLLRDQLYDQSTNSRRFAEAIITEIQFRFEQVTKTPAQPVFE